MVQETKWWSARRRRDRWILAGIIAGMVGASSVVGWHVIAGWGGSTAAAEMRSLGMAQGRQPPPQVSEAEARVGLDARLERLSARQARTASVETAAPVPAAGVRSAVREQVPPPRVPPTPPPLDLFEEASGTMEGQR